MTSLDVDDELEALNRYKRELQRRLAALLAQNDTLTPTNFDQRQESLQRQIHEIEHRLADLNLDEQSLRRMEGGE